MAKSIQEIRKRELNGSHGDKYQGEKQTQARSSTFLNYNFSNFLSSLCCMNSTIAIKREVKKKKKKIKERKQKQ